MKQHILVGSIILIATIIAAIITPWNQYKTLIAAPIIVISALIGTLIAKNFFVE